MASSGLGVCVSVVQGGSTVVKERLLRVPDTCSLEDLLLKVVDDGMTTEGATVMCCKQKSPWINADIKDDVGLLVSDFGCRYIRFQIPPPQPSPPKRARLASEVLMAGAHSRKALPKPKSSPVNKKEEVFNDVRDLLKGRSIGFSSASADGEGFRVVNSLTNALWSIDACHDTLKEAAVRRGQANIPLLPQVWQKFEGYNDYKSKKIAKPRLKSPVLKEHAQSLFEIAGLPSLQSSDWYQTKLDIEGFASTLDEYANYLDDANRAQTQRQGAAHPARQVEENTVIVHKPSLSFGRPSSSSLEQLLKDKEYYEPVFLGDKAFYKSLSGMQKYRFVESLALSFPVDMLKYNPGGNVGNVIFVWRVHENRSESDMMTDSVRMAVKLKPLLPEFHTRQQRIDFSLAYGNLVKISPAIRRSLYTSLTGDCSASQNPEMDARISYIVHGESSDLIYDLRQLNTGRVPSYETFFTELGKVVEEWAAVDERRHGVMHMSEYLSLPDLCSKVKSRCPDGTPIPSLDLIRLQFCPKNPSAHAAINFTGRFKVKYKIQVRQLRLKHIDDHYAAALFKYLRELSVRFREECSLVFADDKSKIDVGEPGALVSTGVRGKKTLAPASSSLSALDHDLQSLSSLTPSVTMFCDIPESIESSFYRGQVHVCLKDAVFQASSPFRHGAELHDLMKRKGDIPPVLLLYTDGGPDHRVTYYSVKCALINLFLKLDLDMLIAVRTAPGHSWANPVERVMSLLNLAIQNVAIARASSAIDSNLQSCSTMADVRNLARNSPVVKKAWRDSLKGVVQALEYRFERLSLKGVPIQTEECADEDDIDDFSQKVKVLVDPTIDLTNLQKKDVAKYTGLLSFLDSHTRSRQYSFQIRKCDQESCKVCKKPRSLKIDDLHWLPDPEPNPIDPNKYLPFSSLYGKETSEKFRPSLSEKGEGDKGRDFSASRARNVIICGECLKPRIVYSQYVPTPAQKISIDKAKESADYVCGSSLLPVNNEHHVTLYVRVGLECNSPIETAYYSSNLALPLICYYCGSFNAERDPELLKIYRSVTPLCKECKTTKVPLTKLPFPKK